MNKQQIGRFRLYRQDIDELRPEVLRIMRDCVVVRAEMMYDTQCIGYVAISHWFEEVPRNGPAPEYVFRFDANGDMTVEKLTGGEWSMSGRERF